MAKRSTTKSKVVKKVETERRRRRGQARTKKQICIDLMSRSNGASIAELAKATGWQMHSVRGFLSRTSKTVAAFALTSDKPDGGVRRYRVVQNGG